MAEVSSVLASLTERSNQFIARVAELDKMDKAAAAAAWLKLRPEMCAFLVETRKEIDELHERRDAVFREMARILEAERFFLEQVSSC